MKKKVDQKMSAVSRRAILTGAVAAVLASSSVKLLAGSTPQPAPTGNEEVDLFRFLILWVVATNSHSDLKFPISAATVKTITGLESTQPGDRVDTTIKYINSHAAAFKNIRKEFDKFTNAFLYAPGQCPKVTTTLRKLADQDPNA